MSDTNVKAAKKDNKVSKLEAENRALKDKLKLAGELGDELGLQSNLEKIKKQNEDSKQQYTPDKVIEEEFFDLPCGKGKTKKMVKRTYENGVIKNSVVAVMKNGKKIG